MAKTKLKYRSDALAVAHKTAVGLHRAGVIDKGTMREFDASCLTTVEELSPKAIQTIRERTGVSQAVFASYLNVKSQACERMGAWGEEAERPILEVAQSGQVQRA